MLNDFFGSFSVGDWLALGIGVALGVVVIFWLRARQVWAYRRSYGYDIYTADTLRRRFVGWAFLAMLIGAAVIVLFVLTVQTNGTASHVGAFAAKAKADPLDGMKLVIPRLGIETDVIDARIVGQDWDISQLTTEIAHLQGTSYPGQPGNAALAGHITIPGAGWGPFHELETMQPGDEIAVRTKDNQLFTYRVSDKLKVYPDDVKVTLPTGDTRLTLMTCSGWDGSVNRYTERIVIVALLVK